MRGRSTGPLIAALLLGAVAAQAASFPPLTPADKLVAAKAAGFVVKGRAIYNECEVPAEMIAFEQVDLNGDGKFELFVEDGGACYGNGGSMFAVIGKGPAGWKRLFVAQGMPVVLKTAHGGWKDVQVGGPGFGRMPIARWNGTAYRLP